MAAPVVASRATGASSTSNTTSHPITMPSGIAVGDLLLVVFSNDGSSTITASSGWNKLGQASYSNTVTGAIFWKYAEGSDTCTVTTSVSEQSSHVSLRITGTTGTPTGATSNGSGTDSDPSSHTAAVVDDHLWIVTRSGDSTVTASGPPANYGNHQSIAAAGNQGASTDTAERTINASQAEDPGTWTSNSEQWVCWTISVPPDDPPTMFKEFAYGNGLGGDATATTSVDVAVGDLLVAVHGADYGAIGDMPALTGTDSGDWVQQAQGDQGNNAPKVKIWTRTVATAGAQTVTAPIFASAAMFVGVYVIDSANLAPSPVDAAAGGNGSSSSLAAPSVTTTTDNSLLVCGWTTVTGGDFTPPTGMIEQIELDSAYGSFATAWELLAASGATGTKTSSFSASTGYAAGTIAIKLASAGGGTEYQETGTDPAGLTDAATVTRERTHTVDAAETLGLGDTSTFTAAWARVHTDTTGLIDTSSSYSAFARTGSDDAGLTDTSATAAGFARSSSASAGLSDSVTVSKDKNLAHADTAGLTDADTVTVEHHRDAVDTLGLDEGEEITAHYLRDLDDSAGLSDSVVVAAQSGESRTDTLGLTDTAAITAEWGRATTESAGLADEATPAATFPREAADAAGLSDSAEVSLLLLREAADAAGLSDSDASTRDYLRAVTDSAGASDEFSGAGTSQVARVDAAGVSDSAEFTAAWAREVASETGLTDTATVGAEYRLDADDPTGLGDTGTATPVHVRAFTDTTALGDTARFAREVGLSATDAAGLADAHTVAVEYRLDASDDTGASDDHGFDSTLRRTGSDAAGLSDSVAFTRTTVATDSTGASDAAERAVTFSREHADFSGVTDTNQAAITTELPHVDEFGLTDSAELALTLGAVADEATGLIDSAAFGRATTHADAAGLAEVVLVEVIHHRDAVDTAEVSDSHTTDLTHVITVEDSVGLAEDFLGAATFERSYSDELGPVEEFTANAAQRRVDPFGLTDEARLSLLLGFTDVTVFDASGKWQTGAARLEWEIGLGSEKWALGQAALMEKYPAYDKWRAGEARAIWTADKAFDKWRVGAATLEE